MIFGHFFFMSTPTPRLTVPCAASCEFPVQGILVDINPTEATVSLKNGSRALNFFAMFA